MTIPENAPESETWQPWAAQHVWVQGFSNYGWYRHNVVIEGTEEVVVANLSDALSEQVAADHNRAKATGDLVKALEHALFMNRWQFDEHRTGGYGELKDESFCRCDWCKDYRGSRYEGEAALAAFKESQHDHG